MIQVNVFGIREEAPTGSCSCGGDCSSATEKTMGELFEDLVQFCQASDLAAKVQLQFIDLFEDDLKAYETPNTMFKNGFALPLVAINGVVRFYGGISNSKIYDVVRAEQENLVPKLKSGGFGTCCLVHDPDEKESV